MKKTITITCLIGSLAIILGQFHFFEALFAFILTGAVPGTTYNIPSGIMYLLAIGGMSLVIIWFIGARVLAFLYAQSNKYLSSPTEKPRRKHLPKRRYSQI